MRALRPGAGRGRLVALLALAVLAPAPAAQDGDTPVRERGPVPRTMSAEEARLSLDRAVGWLTTSQNPDGSWASDAIESVWEANFAIETYYAWQMASQGLALQALLRVEETTERRAALDAGVEWLLTTRMPKRGDGWDVDYAWAMLCDTVALVELADDPRFADPALQARIAERAGAFLDLLDRNQAFHGGWGYYDDPPFTQRPKWGTSFSTASVVPALGRALELGWLEDPAMRDRALTYVQRCALPTGAYEYDLSPVPRVSGGESINDVKGSLGRIQVCNWARRASGDQRVTDEVIRDGLEAFFRDHMFLDAAFMRPVPHEAYYANAAYFYHFGHYYAAEVIELLPVEERAAWHARLRPHLVKTQRADGRLTDFLATGYLTVASTAYTAMALQAGLDDVAPEAEPVADPGTPAVPVEPAGAGGSR